MRLKRQGDAREFEVELLVLKRHEKQTDAEVDGPSSDGPD